MRTRRQAFTLVELLVVIGIIAVLIGILLPALGRAQRNARMTACLSNQRQLVMALMMYIQENKGVFPGGSGYFAYRDSAGNSQPPTYIKMGASWDTNAFNPYSCNQDEKSGPTYLTKYVAKSKKIPGCPGAYEEVKDTGTDYTAYRTSYWYPMSLVYEPVQIWNGSAALPEPNAPVQTPQKLVKVKYPVNKVVIIDRKTYHEKLVHDVDKTPSGNANNTKLEKGPRVAAGFADGHCDYRYVYEMFDSDVNWTGRFSLSKPWTYTKGRAGVLWKDFE